MAQLIVTLELLPVELSKLQEIIKKSVTDMTDLEKWAVFFRYASDPTHRETVNKVIESLGCPLRRSESSARIKAIGDKFGDSGGQKDV